MLVKSNPLLGVDYFPGDVFFTRRPGALLAQAIQKFTGEGPTHCGLIDYHGFAVEAVWPRVRRFSISEIMDDPDVVVEVRTPLGQTQDSTWRLIEAARSCLGRDYDLDGMVLFPFRPKALAEDDNQWFCSELVAWVLANFGPVDAALVAQEQAPYRWSPGALYRHGGLWKKTT